MEIPVQYDFRLHMLLAKAAAFLPSYNLYDNKHRLAWFIFLCPHKLEYFNFF